MPSCAATDAKNSFGRLLQAAARSGAVAITRRNQAEAVLLSIDEYQALTEASGQRLDSLSADFDALLAGMQTDKSRRGARQAFNAAPAKLGRAALRGVAKRER